MPIDAAALPKLPPSEQRVLVVPSTRADGLAMGKVFGANEIASAICPTMAQLREALTEGAGAVIVSEEAVLADATQLVAWVSAQPVWSDLPVIVLSRSGRESVALAEMVARLGNVSVVERPVRTSTLLSLVRTSLRARARQYEVREYLAQQEQAQRTIRERVESERAARAEAERAGRTKDEFLATLSHELRTPLSAVLGWTQVLRRSPELSSEAANAVMVIDRNARAQAQIIEDLLDMSGIISGKVRLNMQRVDLASLIRATVETIKPSAQSKNIRLQVALDPDAGFVIGDAHRLQQVLWNLLTNALKFTPKGGRVSIGLNRVGSDLEIEVADDGEGIDPKFLPHVFDRFRQADPSSTRRHGGLGLGLSIVKQLVEMHGGAITASSVGRDHGAAFRVTLPLLAAMDHAHGAEAAEPSPAQSSVAPPPAAAQPVDLREMDILVVDDEPDGRALIRRLLEDSNAHVTTASSASEAIDALTRNPYDIVVSDIGMPGEDGYVLIRRIRALGDGRSSTPAIALTAYARAEDRSRAMQAGFQAHLSKPVEPARLMAAIQALAKRSGANDEATEVASV